MKMQLDVSPQLHLPLEFITETVAILAKRGVGKTYTASVITEEIIKVGGHVIAIDPVGVWWGLRASDTGEPSGGLRLLILGGSHGDMPLDPNAGQAVADIVIGERLSCVIDLSLMTQEEFSRFLAPFLERIYQINREALHIMVDEADAVAPQVPARGEAAMLAAMDRIVRRGRARGLGVTLITQRPAVLNKNVLTQVELLIVMRMTSPNDRKAVDTWIQAHGTEQERQAVMNSLAKLEVGEAWFWSPAWLSLLQRVHIRQRQTFDSSSTPKVGQTLVKPRTLASVDLSALRERFHSSITAGTENNPEQLRQRINVLEQRMREQPTVTVVKRVEVPILREGEAEQLTRAADNMIELGKSLLAAANEIKAVLATHNLMLAAPRQSEQLVLPPHEKATASQAKTLIVSPKDEVDQPLLSVPQKRILNALAAFAAFGLKSVARSNVAVWADQSPTSSGYANNLGRLRTLSLINYPTPGYLALTEQGQKRVKLVSPMHSLEELHQAWMSRLPRPQGRILIELWSCYPAGLSRSELARRAEQSVTSSGFSNNLGALRALGLIDYPSPQNVSATKLAFPCE